MRLFLDFNTQVGMMSRFSLEKDGQSSVSISQRKVVVELST